MPLLADSNTCIKYTFFIFNVKKVHILKQANSKFTKMVKNIRCSNRKFYGVAQPHTHQVRSVNQRSTQCPQNTPHTFTKINTEIISIVMRCRRGLSANIHRYNSQMPCITKLSIWNPLPILIQWFGWWIVCFR